MSKNSRSLAMVSKQGWIEEMASRGVLWRVQERDQSRFLYRDLFHL